jgi:hypothetical protein
MSPFTVAVVLILTVLFIVISAIPLVSGIADMDSSHQSPKSKTKAAH